MVYAVADLVSILVFLDQALKDAFVVYLVDFRKVSILVFLDQALKVVFMAVLAVYMVCFNPCFPGSSAESGL